MDFVHSIITPKIVQALAFRPTMKYNISHGMSLTQRTKENVLSLELFRRKAEAPLEIGLLPIAVPRAGLPSVKVASIFKYSLYLATILQSVCLSLRLY